MPYDDILAGRVRRALAPHGEEREREMLGGLMFYFGGAMVGGVINDQLVLRLSPDAATEALSRNSIDATAEADMPGIISVSPAGHERDEDLLDWIELAVRKI
jgi:TfoX/Sxy family transcriptional regulator of competence genes